MEAREMKRIWVIEALDSRGSWRPVKMSESELGAKRIVEMAGSGSGEWRAVTYVREDGSR